MRPPPRRRWFRARRVFGSRASSAAVVDCRRPRCGRTGRLGGRRVQPSGGGESALSSASRSSSRRPHYPSCSPAEDGRNLTRTRPVMARLACPPARAGEQHRHLRALDSGAQSLRGRCGTTSLRMLRTRIVGPARSRPATTSMVVGGFMRRISTAAVLLFSLGIGCSSDDGTGSSTGDQGPAGTGGYGADAWCGRYRGQRRGANVHRRVRCGHHRVLRKRRAAMCHPGHGVYELGRSDAVRRW